MADEKNQGTRPAQPKAPTPQSKRAATKKALEAQEKVTLMLEARDGEPKEEIVTINGVQYVIPRGEEVKVPKQVAEIIKDKMRAEKKLRQVSERMVKKLAENGDAAPAAE